MSEARQKAILVLAASDHAEAMRVAAGLTIFGHQVTLLFVDRVVEETEENLQQAELLELTEISPLSLLDDPNIEKIDSAAFQQLMVQADCMMSI